MNAIEKSQFGVADAIQNAGKWILFFCLALVGLGVVMVYSSSSIVAQRRFHDSSFFVGRQMVWALLGIVVMLVVSRIPPRLWERVARGLLLIGISALVLVLFQGQGPAQRWLRFPVLLSNYAFQPAEFVKLALVIYLADVLARKEKQLADFKRGLLPRALVIGVVLVLIAVQPDLGTAIALGIIAVVMLWIGGVRWVHLLAMVAMAAPFLVFSLWGSRYQLERLIKYWDGGHYQLEQALIALGSGGGLGLGPGNSLQKQQFLPAVHTDFVFALVGEELGLAGTLIVIGLFAALAFNGLRIARQAQTYHAFLLVSGLTTMISVYALLNIGVVTGMLPTTGLPLPFISYGGSALIGNLAGVGIILGVARNQDKGREAWYEGDMESTGGGRRWR